MPKMKTKKGAAKRFFVTGSGKFKKTSAFRRHLLMCKTSKGKRQLRTGGFVHKCHVASVKIMLPYH